MRMDDGDPRDLLELAEGLLRRADRTTAGLWPRASALLVLQALEATMLRVWEHHTLDLQACPMRTQLLCLRSYLQDAKVGARADHAWSALSRACHHHPYELAPTSAELQSWFSTVRELIESVGLPSDPPAARSPAHS